ncbi:MAG: iron-sulfur cluster assembly accessory protein [Alkalimonas sp.]|nr:iron-sulfur cluster assembly accessory protein [Alkalimonas sp.]
MHVETFTPTARQGDPIRLTQTAIDYFESMLAKQPGKVLRLSTKVSGCSGYAYVLDFVPQAADSDTQVQASNNLTICIDQKALSLVQDTEIDYVKEGLNGLVKFNNPNVVAECGCGESFNVG